MGMHRENVTIVSYPTVATNILTQSTSAVNEYTIITLTSGAAYYVQYLFSEGLLRGLQFSSFDKAAYQSLNDGPPL